MKSSKQIQIRLSEREFVFLLTNLDLRIHHCNVQAEACKRLGLHDEAKEWTATADACHALRKTLEAQPPSAAACNP